MKLVSIFKSIITETSGTTSRLKSSDRIVFNPPLVGPSNYKLVAYEWKYKWDEYFSIQKGEILPKRFSDWENANVSTDTGRNIVHLFEIEDINGKIQSVSSESANILLGFAKRGDKKTFPSLVNSMKTLAKLKMQLVGTYQARESWDNVMAGFSDKSANIRIIDVELRPDGYAKIIKVLIGNDEYDFVNRDRDIRSIEDANRALNNLQTDLKSRITAAYRSDYLKSHGVPDKRPYIGDLEIKVNRQEQKIQQMIKSQGQ